MSCKIIPKKKRPKKKFKIELEITLNKKPSLLVDIYKITLMIIPTIMYKEYEDLEQIILEVLTIKKSNLKNLII